MAGLILVGLLVLGGIILVVMLITKQGKKRVRIFSGGYFIVIASFMFYTNHTCGPNSTDVKIMTPQANAIAKSIIESGVPVSLEKIPNLPYKLTNCIKKEILKKYENYRYIAIQNDGNVSLKEISEECFFEHQNRKYKVWLWFAENYRRPDNTHGTIRLINIDTRTGILISFETKNEKIVTDFEKYPKVYSVKSTGICNPLRQ